MWAREAYRFLPGDMHVVETQRTRRGSNKRTGGSTRPYRFGEFDLLAVAMYPSTHEWNTFMYIVADWLLPGRTDPSEILKFQPVTTTSNDDWTNDFHTAVGWLRSGVKNKPLLRNRSQCGSISYVREMHVGWLDGLPQCCCCRGDCL